MILSLSWGKGGYQQVNKMRNRIRELENYKPGGCSLPVWRLLPRHFNGSCMELLQIPSEVFLHQVGQDSSTGCGWGHSECSYKVFICKPKFCRNWQLWIYAKGWYHLTENWKPWFLLHHIDHSASKLIQNEHHPGKTSMPCTPLVLDIDCRSVHNGSMAGGHIPRSGFVTQFLI